MQDQYSSSCNTSGTPAAARTGPLAQHLHAAALQCFSVLWELSRCGLLAAKLWQAEGTHTGEAACKKSARCLRSTPSYVLLPASHGRCVCKRGCCSGVLCRSETLNAHGGLM